MTQFAIFSGCVAPTRLIPVLSEIQKETGCSFASIYRGDDAVSLLNSLGKHTQRQLYDASPAQRSAWGVLGTPNPPDRSTHELRSDGVPYPGPLGRRLAWWQCGLDVDDAHVAAFITAAAKHGWVAFRPYAAGVEYHHVNFKKLPVFFSPDYSYPKHSRGPMVLLLTERLVTLGYLDRRWFHFTAGVDAAVKRFQRDNHFTADGAVGPVTWTALKAKAAAHKRKVKKRKKPAPKPKPVTEVTTCSLDVAKSIAAFEGGQSSDGLFHPYQDAVRVWTIGYGHTEGVSAASKPLTKDQATSLLLSDLKNKYAPSVRAAFAHYGIKPTQKQFDALTSFAYNLGTGLFTDGHDIGLALKSHDPHKVATAILEYDRAGSSVLAGLVRRRKWEAQLYLGGTYVVS